MNSVVTFPLSRSSLAHERCTHDVDSSFENLVGVVLTWPYLALQNRAFFPIMASGSLGDSLVTEATTRHATGLTFRNSRLRKAVLLSFKMFTSKAIRSKNFSKTVRIGLGLGAILLAQSWAGSLGVWAQQTKSISQYSLQDLAGSGRPSQ